MKKPLTKWLLFSLPALAVVGLDQLTKYWALTHLKGQPSIVLIKGALEFSYATNTGMAFGLLENQTVFFLIATVIVLAFIGFIMVRTPAAKKMTLFVLAISMITGGAIGNFIDRIFRKEVIDFIYVSLINFPIFNVADSFVVIGVILLLVEILFVLKEEDLAPLFKRKKQVKEETADGND